MSGAPPPGLSIRAASPDDWPGIWAAFEPVIREGESYPLDRDLDEAQAQSYWFAPDKSVFVACGGSGAILGSYGLRANSTGPARHVANAGFIVHPDHRRRGVAEALYRHALDEARQRGFRAMQFNLVIATNDRAVRLWLRIGFAIVGRLPGAFRRPNGDYADALILFRDLM
jgi:ribosomal protein S18 acetylase RimI-like enzyme